MDIKQLRYFSAVVDEGTVTAAAKKLNMTQPPVTAQIKLLEQELNCRLFDRQGRNLVMTEAGRHFYQRAQTILSICDSAEREMSGFSEGSAGTLSIGAISSVHGNLFSSWIQSFSEKYPDVKYEIYNGNSYELLDQLLAGQLDLAVVRTPYSASGIDSLYIREENLLAAGEKKYLGDKDSYSMKELSEKPLIIYRRWEKIIRNRFSDMGLSPYIRCCNDDAETTLSLALHGMGIALIHGSAVNERVRSELKVCGISDAFISSKIALICRNRQTLSGTASLFWDMMEEMHKENH